MARPISRTNPALKTGSVALLIAGLLLGVLRGGPDVLALDGDLSRFHGNDVTLTGLVNGTPEVAGARVRFVLNVTSLQTTTPATTQAAAGERQSASGAITVWADLDIPAVADTDFPHLSHDDTVVVTGRLDRPTSSGPFDYAEHLLARGIGSVLSPASVIAITPSDGSSAMARVHQTRARLADAIERHVPEPQAAVASALSLGVRGGITPETNAAFRDSGLTHLLAVSGLHVGVLLATVLGLAARLIGRHRVVYLLPPLAVLWLYILLTGAPPSAVRAGLMGTAYLLALATGRASVPINALGLTALLVLAIDPTTAWERSFQLSAAAMAGVLFIGLPLAKRPVWLRAIMQFLIAPAAISLGAVVGSTPLVAFNFGQIPLLSIPATLIAMPLVPPLLISGLLTGAVGLVSPPLATGLGLLTAVLGALLVAIAEIAASVPRTTVEVVLDVRWVWTAYAVMAAIAAMVYHQRWLPNAREILRAVWRGPTGLPRTGALLAGVALLTALPWSVVAFSPGDDLLHVHYLDVGQGDATLIIGPNGETVIIDGGADPRQTLNAIDAVLASGDTRIDLALLTHADADHANGILELARRGRIATLVVTPALEAADPELWQALLASGVAMEIASTGATITVGDLTLDILHPPDPPVRGTSADVNNNSLATLLRWGAATALFTGDLHTTGELLITGEIDADLLQVGHHGSATSSASAFLDAVSPLVAVISVGRNNRFGHPDDGVVARLRARVAPGALFVTATDGSVELISDGARWRTTTTATWPD